MTKKLMKLLFVFVLGFVLQGCSNGSDVNTDLNAKENEKNEESDDKISKEKENIRAASDVAISFSKAFLTYSFDMEEPGGMEYVAPEAKEDILAFANEGTFGFLDEIKVNFGEDAELPAVHNAVPDSLGVDEDGVVGIQLRMGYKGQVVEYLFFNVYLKEIEGAFKVVKVSEPADNEVIFFQK